VIDMAKSKLKVGDKVISNDTGCWTYGLTGTIIPTYTGDTGRGYLQLVQFSEKDAKGRGHFEDGVRLGTNWYIPDYMLKKTNDDTFTVGSHTDLATDINLGPQQRVILQHLKDGKNITQMKAMGVYHIPRLSDVILKLRRKGYDIVTEVVKDEVGGSYASYSLAK
jgi:hypothetical protein